MTLNTSHGRILSLLMPMWASCALLRALLHYKLKNMNTLKFKVFESLNSWLHTYKNFNNSWNKYSQNFIDQS